MKASSNAGETTPKSSLSRSMKKSSKSRTKVSKPNTLNPAPASTTQETPTTSNTPDPLKDKVNHRSYAGFGAKSMKVMWEQHDTSDTEVSSDVYPRLAEDATYKVWELVNNIKTYVRHSGGKVTCELVNEVLKDADVPPILGAGDNEWDKIEYDGTFFFNSDKVVLLREEYLNNIHSESVVGPEITSSWVIDRRFSKNLVEFISFLCNALFLGDEESYKFALETGAFSSQIGCSLKLILKKMVDMLAFEQKSETVDRTLAFLRALSFNPHSRDVECREQLFHLSEVLVCILLGTYESISSQKEQKEEFFELVKNFLESSDQEMKKDVEGLNQMDVDDIRSEYEALFQMMERDGFQERENPEVEGIKETNVPVSGELVDTHIKQENIEPTAIKEEPNQGNCEDFKTSPFKAEMCDFKYVDTICSTIGCMGSQFGYLQNECTFLIQRRLERFFALRRYLEENDYEFISRSVRGLMALGEYAFREMIPFLYKINPINVPEWMENNFAPGAIFLRGREDIFLYEWLEDLCGHKLQPFMLYYTNYHQKLITKRYRNLRNSTYKINPKVLLKIVDKQFSKPTNLQELFPHKTSLLSSPRKIGFRFAGCRPVGIKPKSQKSEVKYIQQLLPKFSAHTVLGKRKLLKPLSNKRKIVQLSNFGFLQL